jgi:cysteine sulfinate desulfinase/cysteine desulfurase-like protein
MRLDSRLAESSLRISLSPDNTTEECEALAEAILTIHRNHR